MKKNMYQISLLGNTISKVYTSFGSVPIYVGWGYSKEDAIVIDKYNIMIDSKYS